MTPESRIHGSLEVPGELAQLGERLVCNQEVTGSIPVFSTNVSDASFRELLGSKDPIRVHVL
jgi:hypothetical protein